MKPYSGMGRISTEFTGMPDVRIMRFFRQIWTMTLMNLILNSNFYSHTFEFYRKMSVFRFLFRSITSITRAGHLNSIASLIIVELSLLKNIMRLKW
jgi:hypothetical protein